MISQQSTDDDDKMTKEECKQAITIQASTFLNLSICYFLQGDYRKCISRATESIDLQPGVKAYYRRAQALAKINDFWGATKDLKEALKLDPTDPNNFGNELARFEQAALAKDKKSDKKLQGFFDRMWDESRKSNHYIKGKAQQNEIDGSTKKEKFDMTLHSYHHVE